MSKIPLDKALTLLGRTDATFNEEVRRRLAPIRERLFSPPSRPARKAHPGLLVRDLRLLVVQLRKANIEVVDDPFLPGYDRVYVSDPFGNRLELMERNAAEI